MVKMQSTNALTDALRPESGPSAKLPTSALPNAVNQLTKMGKVDPDARDLAAGLQQELGGAQ
jgi:uncharacterized protein YidB (DUF937 family)